MKNIDNPYIIYGVINTKFQIKFYTMNRKNVVINRKEEKNMATRDKNIWILIIFLLAGIVIGGLIGEFASQLDFLWWLGYGQSFGLTEPLVLDLSIVSLTFALQFKINIASIIGIGIAIFLYRKA